MKNLNKYKTNSSAFFYSALTGLFIYLFTSLASPVLATEVSNDNWTIQITDINITNPSPLSNQKKQVINDQPLPGQIIGTNYKIKSGFEGLDPLGSFSFSISNTIIDFGILSPTNPIYRTSNLAVSNQSTNGFIVTAQENHPLQVTASNTLIPDSTCDNGSCSEITPALWVNTLTYGFGYHCDNVTGNNCPVDFNQNDYYKQFPDFSKNESPQPIMTSSSAEENHESQITYKVNISKTQTSGSYTNTIAYIASPGF
jgi:hypothetical protein